MHTVSTGRTVRACCALALALGVPLIVSPARAGFLQDFSGNTAPQKIDAKIGQGVNSTINFAVLSLEVDQNGALKDKTDPWGTGLKGFAQKFVAIKGSGSGALDTTAQYLYLYQVTNNQPAGAPDTISGERISLAGLSSKDITSFGYFDGLGLSDTFGGVAGVPVDAGPNFFGNTRTPGDPAIANTKVNGPGVAVLNANTFVNPTALSLVEANKKLASFNASWRTPLGAQQRSTIFGFTTDLDPQFNTATVSGTGPKLGGVFTPNGMAPAPMPNPFRPVPEPSSLMLAGSAMVSLALVRFRRYLYRPKAT